jgi:tetratricopeptide (TPR) repeat protein
VVLLEHVVRLLGDSPRRAEMLWRLGTALDLEQRYDEAAMRFREAAQHDPQFANAYVGLALACAHQGRWAEAVAANEQALRLLPGDRQTNFNLATALVSLGEVDRGVAQFRRTIELEPTAYEPYMALSAALGSCGRYAEALDVLSEGLRHTGGNWSVATRIIWLLAACPDEQLRNGAQAVMLGERLNEKSEGRNPAVLDALAAAYAEAGRFEDAAATARRAVEQADAQGAKEFAAEIRRRLGLYEAGQPYRGPGGLR